MTNFRLGSAVGFVESACARTRLGGWSRVRNRLCERESRRRYFAGSLVTRPLPARTLPSWNDCTAWLAESRWGLPAKRSRSRDVSRPETHGGPIADAGRHGAPTPATSIRSKLACVGVYGREPSRLRVGSHAGSHGATAQHHVGHGVPGGQNLRRTERTVRTGTIQARPDSVPRQNTRTARECVSS